MKIVDLFRQLSFGELSNLAISEEGSGNIVEAKRPQLIHYTNDALLALHARFQLLQKDLLIEQVDHITNYHLLRQYAETVDSDEDFHYIKDTPEKPFTEDVIRILSVWSAECGEYPLNDIGNPRSLFTPSPSTLQIPNPVQGRATDVVYQANHKKLDDRLDAPKPLLDQIINIPIYLENALQLYVAYKVYDHLNGQENIVKGQTYLAAYEAICVEVEQRDLVNQTTNTSHCKLEERGFV